MPADYGDRPSPRARRQPRRERYPDLGPRTPAPTAADAAAWPAWTDTPLEGLGILLSEPDMPLFGRSGRAS